jgi:transcriptional regulator of acetoin/glycerol metabolism
MNNVVLSPKNFQVTRSWERSRQCGLDRGAVPELPYFPQLEVQGALTRAATPVIDRLETMLRGTGSAAVLLDQTGRFLTSRCDDPAFQVRLDRGQSAPGFVWAEEFAGTNAVGIALEERIPMWTTGKEHYLEMLYDLSCAAAPVFNPFTRKLEGAISVAAPSGTASPMMLPVALWAAGEIENRLLEAGTVVERTLLDHFLAAQRRSGRVVLVRGDRTELSTSNAATTLSRADRAYLANRADDVGSAEVVMERIGLSEGSDAFVRFEGISAAGRRIGTLIELVVEHQSVSTRRSLSAPQSSVADAATKSIVGRSQATGFLRAKLGQLAESTFPLVISGESGVGKLTVAQILAPAGSSQIDVSTAVPDTESALIAEISRASDVPKQTVIVRGIGALSSIGMQQLGSIAESAESHGSRIICTFTEHESSNGSQSPAFGVRLHVPPLRERPDDLLDLVPRLLARHDSAVRVAPPAMQVLLRYDWPGNVRELDSVVSAMATSSRGGTITLADVPLHYHRGARRLRRIEHVERGAILQALLECGGNKTRAAELLEIGRATLYRKMRVYGLDVEEIG